jgi:hypothetical protein
MQRNVRAGAPVTSATWLLSFMRCSTRQQPSPLATSSRSPPCGCLHANQSINQNHNMGARLQARTRSLCSRHLLLETVCP